MRSIHAPPSSTYESVARVVHQVMATGGSWTKEETLKLVELWGDSEIQLQLEGCKQNQGVFQKITSLLNEAGYERTYQQWREKMKKLRGEYRKVKDCRRKTGEDRKEWIS